MNYRVHIFSVCMKIIRSQHKFFSLFCLQKTYAMSYLSLSHFKNAATRNYDYTIYSL